MDNTETKDCPFCAEEIKLAAIKYKHCGEFLPAEGGASTVENQVFIETEYRDLRRFEFNRLNKWFNPIESLFHDLASGSIRCRSRYSKRSPTR